MCWIFLTRQLDRNIFFSLIHELVNFLFQIPIYELCWFDSGGSIHVLVVRVTYLNAKLSMVLGGRVC